jgi:hypothetical protein
MNPCDYSLQVLQFSLISLLSYQINSSIYLIVIHMQGLGDDELVPKEQK